LLLNQVLASIVPYKEFKTSDGNILLGGGNDRLYGILCQKLKKPEWIQDSRFVTNTVRVKHREELERLIEAETVQRPTSEWLEVFDGSGMPYAAINDIQATLNHEHGRYAFSDPMSRLVNLSLVLARNMVAEVEHPTCGPMKLVNTPVKYSHSNPSIRSPPPTLGQHTDEILTDLVGMTTSEIEDLKSEGVVA
jgi:succinate--hydroxymethylglutarate CoA-transferase